MLPRLLAAAAQARANRASRVLRRRMLFFALIAAGVTGVLVASLLGSPAGKKLAMPGPISDSHATLADDCGNCHTASLDSFKGPLHGILVSHTSFAESANCMGCHAFGPHALEPHSAAPESAAAISASVQRTQLRTPEFACSTCHHEHRGRDADLTALSAKRCQACHTQSFASIADGHPPFGDYPYVKRLSIAFDHATHEGRHFQEREGSPQTCMECHRSDPQGNMRMAGFETACASCHSAEIEGEGRADATGLAFLGLPAIDVASLREAGVVIGTWPADAEVSDTPLTPITRLLLSADPRSAEDLATVADLDWLDLFDAGEEEVAALGRIAWDVKALWAEIAAGGHEVLRERLEKSLGRALSKATLAELLGGLSPGDLRTALETWLPHLEAELRARGRSSGPTADTWPEPSEPAEQWVTAGGWYSDDYTFTLRRRPRGHADPFLKGWLDLAVRAGGSDARGALKSVFETLSDAEGPGRCTKCHSIEAVPGQGIARVNWREPAEDFSRGALVRFSHAPHVTLLDERGCLGCHELADSTDGFERAYAQRDPSRFVSAFGPISPEHCAECHAPAVGGGDCLTCHQYHAERPRPARLEALPALSPQKNHAAFDDGDSSL